MRQPKRPRDLPFVSGEFAGHPEQISVVDGWDAKWNVQQPPETVEVQPTRPEPIEPASGEMQTPRSAARDQRGLGGLQTAASRE